MQDGPFSDQVRRISLWLIVFITVILSGWALRATGAFMIPVVCSVFLALLVAPLDRSIVSRLPDRFGWLGHIAAMGAILLSLLIFVDLLWVSAQQVTARYPMPTMVDTLLPQFGGPNKTAADAAAQVAGPTSHVPSADDRAMDQGASSGGPDPQSGKTQELWPQIKAAYAGAGDSIAARIADWASTLASNIMLATGTTLTAMVLILFLTLIMLIEGPDWRAKIHNILGSADQKTAMRSVDVIADRLRRYLVARTLLGIFTAGLYVGWLWLFDVDLLVVWALLAFLFNFVPTFGSLITGGLAVAYVFMQKDPGTAALIGAGIFAIEQIVGNYIDPRVQGRQVSLSPVVILITLLVWSWVWGVAGAILAVPITIAAMIICAYVPPMRPFALLLSNERGFEGLDRQTGVSGG
jgi:AI-2 transport protein TqsA